MISILAQTTQSVPLEIPGAVYGISILGIGGIVALILLAGKLLAGMRTFRSNVAKEIKREIEASSAAQRVDVQQPLTVAPHISFVRKPDYERDQALLDERLRKATESRKQLHERLGDQSQRITALEKSERHTEATLANIDQKLTTILQRLPR